MNNYTQQNQLKLALGIHPYRIMVEQLIRFGYAKDSHHAHQVWASKHWSEHWDREDQSTKLICWAYTLLETIQEDPTQYQYKYRLKERTRNNKKRQHKHTKKQYHPKYGYKQRIPGKDLMHGYGKYKQPVLDIYYNEHKLISIPCDWNIIYDDGTGDYKDYSTKMWGTVTKTMQEYYQQLLNKQQTKLQVRITKLRKKGAIPCNNNSSPNKKPNN